MQHLFENSALYTMMELGKAQFAPIRTAIDAAHKWHNNPMNLLSYHPAWRSIRAGYELAERMTRPYPKPDFGIHHTKVEGKEYDVHQRTVITKPFCRLLHFEKMGYREKLPKLLIVAPMSGHHATLLRGTVEDTLPHFDVYITDWIDARDVPVSAGSFDLDDFINYTIRFMEHLRGQAHVMAVCQPAVPVLAAVSIMSAENNPNVPLSMTLIGGPIDTRQSPTEVNMFADKRSMNWFETHVITRISANYPGFMRPVYPGFIQLAGFMAMNMKRHVGEHVKLFQHLVVGDGESADAHRKFYNEYLAVMDLPAEFYLQTIKTVFKEYALPQGKMVSRGRVVDPSKITKTAIFALEGELDDISGVGQTKAAIKLCKNLPDSHKLYHLQESVGHFGLFNGRRFREFIVPMIVKFTDKHNKKKEHQMLKVV